MPTFEEKLLLARLRREEQNAKRRHTNLVKKIEETPVANLLRKEETLAFENHLRPYQQLAVLETVRNFRTGRHTLNATAVGLGKTRVAASFVNSINTFKKVLWITSKTLVNPTVREITSIGGSIVPTTNSAQLMLSLPLPEPTIYITNYEEIKREPAYWVPNLFDAIVIDECSKLKGGAQANPTAIWKETKKFLHHAHPNAFRLFLSGTPAENRPEEIWAYLHLFDPEKFNNFYQFRSALCGTDSKGKLRFSTERLLNLLQGSVIRQTVENLHLQGVPSMKDPNWFTQHDHVINLSPQSQVGQVYLDLQNNLLAELNQDHSLAPSMELEQILRLRQVLTAGPRFTYTKQLFDEEGYKTDKVKVTVSLDGPYPKIDAAEELIASYQSEGEQVIVFSCFNEPLENLHSSLSRTGFYTSALMTGATSVVERDKAIHDFQQGNLDVLLINKKVGAQGLNLQKCADWPGGARIAIHLDRWWNNSIEEQANGRILRMNTAQPCMAVYLHVANSIDDHMLAIIEGKKASIGQMDAGLLKHSLERFTLG